MKRSGSRTERCGQSDRAVGADDEVNPTGTKNDLSDSYDSIHQVYSFIAQPKQLADCILGYNLIASFMQPSGTRVMCECVAVGD